MGIIQDLLRAVDLNARIEDKGLPTVFERVGPDCEARCEFCETGARAEFGARWTNGTPWWICGKCAFFSPLWQLVAELGEEV